MRHILEIYDLVPPIENFTLPHTGKNNKNSGIRTGAGEYIWKTYTSSSYDDPASIHYEHRLLMWLRDRGLPFAVPIPIPTKEGTLFYQSEKGGISLIARLPGARLKPNRLNHVERLGDALGKLQMVLQDYRPEHRPGRPLFGALFDFSTPVCNPFTLTPRQLGYPNIPPYNDLLSWWREETVKLQAFVTDQYHILPRQVCHNDFTPDNVLVEAGQVSAVLDFEFAAPAARALDVAMGLRRTMRTWENAEPWETVRCFCRGYTAWIRLTTEEIQALPWLIRLRSAIPILWWLGRQLDLDRIPTLIEYQQNFVRWLDHHERQLVDTIAQAVFRGQI